MIVRMSVWIASSALVMLAAGCAGETQNGLGPDDVAARANRDRASTETRSGGGSESPVSRETRVERSSSALSASRPTNTSRRQQLKSGR